MRASTFVWIAAAAVPRLVKADGGGDNWYTTTCWETETTWQMKTMWATTTCWSTYETTITDYITDTTTETDTDYITKYSTLTSIVSVPYTVPVTITDISTVVSVSTKNVPVPTTIVSYATEVETTTIVEITSIPYGVTNTATQINTQISQITSVQVQTVEETVTVFVTVQGPTISVPYTIVQTPPSAPPTPTSTLTGLVPCPSRVTNPTYTASTPIPTEWTWGCPPGTLCKPKQVDCNFEVDLPADGYICSPDECVVPPPLPSPSDLDSWIDYSCNTLFTPSPGYFNIVPTSFGYGGDSIFAFGGQTAVPCTSQPVTQISDGQPQAPTGPAVTQISDGQPQAATGAPITQISDGQPQATVTARAVLEERAAGVVPRNCYSLCDNAGYDAQATGKVYSGLCLPPNPFQKYLSACNACIAKQSPVPPYTAVTPLLPSMGQWIAFCTNEAKALGAPTSSTPASQLAPPSSSAAPPASTSASATVSASASPTTLSSASATPPPPTATATAPPAGTTSSSLISQLTQISDGQPQAPTSPSSFTGAASSIIRAQDSWWITLLSFLITLF